MNKLGIHCQKWTDRLKNIIAQWRPPLVVWVDPDPDGIARIRAVSPGTFIVGRKYEQGGWNSPNLKDRAYWWADRCAEIGRCDAYYCWNEPFGHDSRDLFARFDDYQMWFRERILQHGIEAVGLNMATGNFTRDGPNVRESFPKTCANFKYLGIHEYSWPSMKHGEGYYCNRFPFWLADVGRDDVTVIVTECGMTQAVVAGRPDEGWRSGADGVTDDVYLDSLRWYNGKLAEEERVLGGALFNFEGWGWATFEHADWPRLPEVMALDAPGPEPPENGGEEEMEYPKVFDLEYKERDWDYAKTKYGVAFRRADAEPGQKVYRLMELREKTGHHSLIVQVLDEDGQPVEGARPTFYWPDADEFPYPSEHDWYSNFIVCETGENGECAPGAMGKGAYHGEGEGGPHASWVHDLDVPSDICEKLGMLAGTNHDHFDLMFQRVVEGEEGGEDKWFTLKDKTFQEEGTNRIMVYATGKQNFYDVRLDVRIKDTNIDFDPVGPETLTKFVFCTDYEPPEDESSRTYLIQLRHPDGTPLSDEWECPYQTGVLGWWQVQVDGEEEEEPALAWEMTVSREPGASVLAGNFPRADIALTVSDPWGNVVSLVSGSKTEHGAGGFETPIWHAAAYTVRFLDQSFEVRAGGEFVFCEFVETEGKPEGEARLVSGWMPESDAEALLAELEAGDYQGVFSLEQKGTAASAVAAAVRAFRRLLGM